MASGFRETSQVVSAGDIPATLTFGTNSATGTLGQLKSGREMRNAGIIPTFDEEFTILVEDFTPLGVKFESNVTVNGRNLRIKDISYQGVFVMIGLKEIR